MSFQFPARDDPWLFALIKMLIVFFVLTIFIFLGDIQLSTMISPGLLKGSATGRYNRNIVYCNKG